MSTARQTGKERYLALVALLLGLAVATSVERSSRGFGLPSVAQRGAPRELTFALLDGGSWRLSEEQGHVVAVNLWATWCEPCRSETPLLLKMSADLHSKGFRVIGVSLDAGPDKETNVRHFRETYRVMYPLASPDPLSQLESGLEGVPTTLLFDRHGRAAKVYVGEVRESSLRADVSRLLMEP